MLTPKQVIAGFQAGFEGGLSVHPSDNGNWYDQGRYMAGQAQKRGLGSLVGSMRGVTAYALINYRLRKGVPLEKAVKVTRADMAAITAAAAIDIGYELYFVAPGFDKLVWNRVTASILDKAWGSGAKRAIIMTQDMIGATVDGKLGPKSVLAYAAFIAKHGEEEAAALWADQRLQFDHQLAVNDGPEDPDAAFVNGWNNRTRSFLPGTPWWRTFAA
jgi:hypothetical protein